MITQWSSQDQCSVPTTPVSIINFYTDENRLTNNTMTQSPHYKFSICQLPQVITKNCDTKTVKRVIFCCRVYPPLLSVLLLIVSASNSVSVLVESAADVISLGVFLLNLKN